jgi:hypothetical protein
MSSLSKSLKIRFKTRPKGFYKKLEQELENAKIAGRDFEESTPKDTGDLRASNRVRAGKDRVTISSRESYASYVDKSGPRRGGPGIKGYFRKRANSKFVNKIARQVRDELIKAQKKRGK